MEPEIPKISQETLKVIKKLEEALNILKYKAIKNEDCLEYIKKPVDDLLSSLKYLPTEPLFTDLPTEIKTNILEYLCDSGALAAATVCEEWKEILQIPVKKLEKVRIGNHCSNKFECGVKCCLPEAMLKGVTNLKLNVPLTICHPLTEVDSQLVAEALSSVSKLSIIGDCSECVGDDYYDIQPILTDHQKEQLLVSLENRTEKMKKVELRVLDLTNLDQERLVNFLVYKNGCLSLDKGDYGPNLDIRKLVEKLKDSNGTSTLRMLYMNLVQYPEDLAEDMADALCRVFYVSLHPTFRIKIDTIKRLLANILHRPIEMKCLLINKKINWSTVISPDDLVIVLDKMTVIGIKGIFTPEQLEAATNCPGIQVVFVANSFRISKGINVH